MSDAPVIVWFREDLRVTDQPALRAAAASGRAVLPLYVLDEQTQGEWAPGGAQRWWLHHSLTALGDSLSALGAPLVLKRGRYERVLESLSVAVGAGAVYFSRGYEPWAGPLEARLHRTLAERGVAVKRFPGRLLLEPEQVRSGRGEPYRVFTPFWRASLKRLPPRAPTPAPARLSPPKASPPGERLEDWALLPRAPDWSGGLAAEWTPGEEGAAARLQRFLAQAVGAYDTGRDLPGAHGTSKLSPHLHFGEISPRQVWHAVAGRFEGETGAPGAGAFLREIGWREFSHHLLAHWPEMPERAFRPEYERFPWREDPQALRRWQRGQTGYPIVDAGMRELYATGWMHNRVRMIVASFLVKHLLVHWREGERWFRDTLVDADLASNTAGWQWVAGSGADAAPYFRIFNPTLQGQKFDARGTYVRRWVPELAGLPDRYLHEPSAAPPGVLAAAGVSLGENYPHPMVEHRAARQRALDALAQIT